MSKSYYPNATLIYHFWLANGFSPEQATGLLAQGDAESSLDPTAIGDHDQAFGLDQWHVGRCEVIRKGCGVDLDKKVAGKVVLPSLEDQLKAALWELHHPEHYALAKILATKTAFDAGHDACRYWERPKSPLQWDKRGQTAQKWFDYFNKPKTTTV